jgi:hypothetical protein
MWHRPLSEMLTDVFSAVEIVQAPGLKVRPRQVELKLPIEIGLRDVGGELTFIADLPLWRWRTDFDQRPSQLRITYEESKL